MADLEQETVRATRALADAALVLAQSGKLIYKINQIAVQGVPCTVTLDISLDLLRLTIKRVSPQLKKMQLNAKQISK